MHIQSAVVWCFQLHGLLCDFNDITFSSDSGLLVIYIAALFIHLPAYSIVYIV